MLLVSLTNLRGSLVSLQIIVLLTQRQTALEDIDDVLCSVLLVSTNVGVEEFL